MKAPPIPGAAAALPAGNDDLTDDESTGGNVPSIISQPPPPMSFDAAADAEYNRLPAAMRAKLDRAAAADPKEELLCWSPQKIAFTYDNDEGNRCFTILFALTSGAVNTVTGDNSGVDIQVTPDGWEIRLEERWHNFMTDAELFYNRFPMAANETQDEYNKRRFAMIAAVRDMKKHSLNGALKSEYRYKLPFRVDPGEKKVTFVGTSNGCRVAAVDLHERKKHERMSGCLIVDDDEDMKTPCKKMRREVKPNPKYQS